MLGILKGAQDTRYSQIYPYPTFERLFEISNLGWITIYFLPRIATADTIIRAFQYKLLKNVLFLNKMLYRFGILQDTLCSFCSLEEETPIHIQLQSYSKSLRNT